MDSPMSERLETLRSSLGSVRVALRGSLAQSWYQWILVGLFGAASVVLVSYTLLHLSDGPEIGMILLGVTMQAGATISVVAFLIIR